MGPSIWQLLIVLAIIVVIFGTKKLRNMGGDIGGAIKNFKQSMKDETKNDKNDKNDKEGEDEASSSGRIIDGEITQKKKDNQHS